MAENGNRGPNDFRSRNVRKRREPPIIDASATEVPLDPTEPVAGEGADAVASPEAQARDAGAVTPDTLPLPHGTPEAREATPTDETPFSGRTPDSGAAPSSHEAADPVIFGSPPREASARPEEATAHADPASSGAFDGAEPSSISEPPTSETMASASAASHPAVDPVRTGPAGGAVPPGADRPGGGAAPWLLTVSTLALLGALAWTLYTEPQRSGAPEIAELRSKVAALEARPDPAQIQGAVAALDKRLGAADAERAGLAKTVADLSTRLDGAARQAQAAETDATKPAPSQPAPTGAAAVATVGALAALAAEVAGVDTRVAALSTAQDRTAKAVADVPKPDFGPVDARVSALDVQAKALDGRLGGLDGRVGALDGKLNGSDARLNGFDAKVNGVDGKINGFDARMNGLENRTNGIDARLADTAGGVGRLQAAVAGLPHVDLGPLQAATTALDGKVSAIEDRLAAPKDGARLTEARAVGSADETRAAPIALVGQAVGRAIAEGRPYAPDLDALKALGAEPDALAKLSPLAAQGAPTAAALLDRWNAVQGDVLAAVKPAEAGTAFDRFAANARALVQVRRVGAVQGDDPAAVVSQVGGALGADDVPAALAAWGRLPKAGQDKSQDWAAAARARVDAAEAAQSLVGRAIATLGKTKS